MLNAAHHIFVWLHVLLPVLVAVWALWRLRRARTTEPLKWLMSTAVTGALLGVILCVIYSYAVGGLLITTQILLAMYFGASLLVLLKGTDQLLLAGLRGILGRRQPERRPRKRWTPLIFAVRLALLVGVVLPYSMAAIMIYRPKVAPADDPGSRLGLEFQRVSFDATDGMPIVGWWIPAEPRPRWEKDRADWGLNTVIVGHGLAANKSNHLVIADQFLPHGFNALIFDFRAHGESGGQFTSFGDHERRDVLGAVRWVQQNRAEQSQRIFGVGTSMGAAAIIAAAADPGPEGRAIEAVAVYGTYANLRQLADEVGERNFPPPIDWLTSHVGLPMAGVFSGSRLQQFAPEQLAMELWPRPLMVIHGTDDEIIPFSQGRRLFDRATQPKQRLWIEKGDHNGIILDPDAGEAVREFFRTARDVPVI